MLNILFDAINKFWNYFILNLLSDKIINDLAFWCFYLWTFLWVTGCDLEQGHESWLMTGPLKLSGARADP